MESPLRPPAEPDFRLIETLGYRPGHGLIRQERHLARMARSAAAFGIAFDINAAIVLLNRIEGQAPLRCRLTLAADGRFDLTTGTLDENPPLWQLGIAGQRLSATDIWLRHKTTRRAIYDIARASLPPGTDELLFLNDRDELCEGTITNLFLTMPDGRRLTPALSSGLLPGVLRAELIDNKQVTEADLTLTDLRNAQTIHLGNSLRGLIRAELVEP
ncbi:4-amino-4-deoxychorismate lyase [Rhodobacteraceae bacterium KLH11]|nr:4-amino-4-deoxychorismate lyase [Rhodobacteraceae bacterium KLH11]